jgi:oligoendopeptidase F
VRKARPRRWPRPSAKILRTFTLITNTLAKDKEISDRWRGFEDVADSRHLANRVEREVVDALVPPCARPIRACRTAITS